MNELEKRVDDLEIKFSYQDDLINELNIIVSRQQNQIEKMAEVITGLSENSSDNSVANSSLKNERPPHY